MLGILILMFTVIPVVEFYFLVNAAGAIGISSTIGIVLLTGVVGAFLAKSQGRSLLLEIQKKTAQGEAPTDAMIQGLMVLVGGVLLVTPGFVTDAIGFSLVVPFTRWIYLGLAKAYFFRQLKTGNFKVYSNVNVNSQQWTQNFTESKTRDVTPPQIQPDDKEQ